MNFLEDPSCCCCTTLVATTSDTPFAAIEAPHFYTILYEHEEPVIPLSS